MLPITLPPAALGIRTVPDTCQDLTSASSASHALASSSSTPPRKRRGGRTKQPVLQGKHRGRASTPSPPPPPPAEALPRRASLPASLSSLATPSEEEDAQAGAPTGVQAGAPGTHVARGTRPGLQPGAAATPPQQHRSHMFASLRSAASHAGHAAGHALHGAGHALHLDTLHVPKGLHVRLEIAV